MPRKRSRKKIGEQLLTALRPRRPTPQVEHRAPVTNPMMSHPGKAITLNPGRLHLGKAEGQISSNEFEEPTAMQAPTQNAPTIGQTLT